MGGACLSFPAPGSCHRVCDICLAAVFTLLVRVTSTSDGSHTPRYAEFRPALMIPNEQRITSFS